MKWFKKISALLLVCCMVMTMAVGCDKQPADSSAPISDNSTVSTESTVDTTTEAVDPTGDTTADATGEDTTDATGEDTTDADGTTTTVGGSNTTASQTQGANGTTAPSKTQGGNSTTAPSKTQGNDKTTTAPSKTQGGNKTTAPSKTQGNNKTTTATKTTANTDVTAPTQAQNSKFPGRVTNLNGRTVRFNMPPNMETNPNNESVKRRNALVEDIEKTYNCNIEFYLRYSESAGDNTIATSVLAGDPVCDVWIQNGASEFMAHYNAGLLQDLSRWKTIDFQRTENPWSKSIELFKMNGSYYALTDLSAIEANYATSSYVMYYNPKLLKQYGITEDLFALQESGKWTWDKFAEICKKFAQNSPANMAPYYDFDLNLYHALLYTNGTDWIVNDGNTPYFNGNDQKAQAALTKYREWTADGIIKVPAAVTTTSVFQNKTYSFFAGLAPFNVGLITHLEWGLMQGGQTTQDVKDNYGILMLPKWKESDEYNASVYASQIGGYCIPFGVSAANEVLTVMDAFYSFNSPTDGDPTEKYLQNHIDKWLNSNTGANSRKTVARLHKLFLTGKNEYTFGWMGSYTTPDIRSDSNNGWYSHVLKIANGTEAMGSALSSVTNTYNNALKNFYSGR